MKLKRLAVVLVVAGLVLAFYGFSGSVSAADVDVTFTILSTQTLTISGTPVAFSGVTLDVPTAAQTVVVTVKSNVAYKLTYTAPTSFDGTTSVPIGRLTYNSTTFLAGVNTLESNHARTTGAGVLHSYDYVLTVDFDDADPGSYTGTIIYTVSTP
jgi:hypothetical protein